MPLDPAVQAMLEAGRAMGRKPFDEMTPQEARDQMKAFAMVGEPEKVAHVADSKIPTPDGDIPVRIYTPENAVGTLVYYHGGGWVIGDIESHDAPCRHLANLAGCAVVSVDYRLAPEHVYPAAVEDGYAALEWVAKRATELGNSSRVAIGGDSAGANVAAAVALMTRDRKGPEVALQLLVYPVTDYNFDTPSYAENGTDYGLTQGAMRWFWNHYAPDPARAVEPYASPLRAESLADLAPALVMTAEFDPLRDEGEAYAKKLQAAGVPTTMTRYDGYNHGFFSMFAMLDRAELAHQQAAEALKKAFRA